MEKRLKIQCWNCPKTYFETLDITAQEVIVTCPYCKTEAKLNLRPYRKQKNDNVVVIRDTDVLEVAMPSARMAGDSSTDAPPPAGDVKKKRK